MTERERGERAEGERAASDKATRRDPVPAPAQAEVSPPLARFDRMGNRAMLGLLRTGRVLPRRAVSVPDDPVEVAADRAADEALSAQPPTALARAEEATIARRVDEFHELARQLGLEKAPVPAEAAEALAPAETAELDPLAKELLANVDHGDPLDATTRADMESRFGQSFGTVRVHTGDRSAEAAMSIDARAFTVGEHVVFNRGEYAPESTEGRRLLAHELAHVVQQGITVGFAGTRQSTEDDAEHAAGEALAPGTISVRERATPGVQIRADLPSAAEAEAQRAAAARRNTYEQPSAHQINFDFERTGISDLRDRLPPAAPARSDPRPVPVATPAMAAVTGTAPALDDAPPYHAAGEHGPFSRAGASIPIAPPDDPLEAQALTGRPSSGLVSHGPLAVADGPAAELLHGIAGGGSSLPASLRAEAESRFGVPLVDVRVFTDVAAASALRARAFAYGRNIFFGPGEYTPETARGRDLALHELVHVEQQRHADEAFIQRDNPTKKTDGDWQIEDWAEGFTLRSNPKDKRWEILFRGTTWVTITAPKVSPPATVTFDFKESALVVNAQSEADLNITVDQNVEIDFANYLVKPATVKYELRSGGHAHFSWSKTEGLTVGKQLMSGPDGPVMVEKTFVHDFECPVTLTVLYEHVGEAMQLRRGTTIELDKLLDSFPTFDNLEDAKRFIAKNKGLNFLVLEMPDGRIGVRAVNEDQLQKLADTVRSGSPDTGWLPEFVRYHGKSARGELMTMWLDGKEVSSLHDLADMYYSDPADIGMEWGGGTGRGGGTGKRKARDVLQECEIFQMGQRSYGRRLLRHDEAVALWKQLDGLSAAEVWKRTVDGDDHKFQALRVAGKARLHDLDLRYFQGRDMFREAIAKIDTAKDDQEARAYAVRFGALNVTYYLDVEMDRETDSPAFISSIKASSRTLEQLKEYVWTRIEERAQHLAMDRVQDAISELRPYDDDKKLQMVILTFHRLKPEQQKDLLDFLGVEQGKMEALAVVRETFQSKMSKPDQAIRLARGETITQRYHFGERPPPNPPALAHDVSVSLTLLRSLVQKQLADLQDSLAGLGKKSNGHYETPVILDTHREDEDKDGFGDAIRRVVYKEFGFSLDPRAFPHYPASSIPTVVQVLQPGTFVGRTLVDAIESSNALAGNRSQHANLMEQIFVNMAVYREAIGRLKLIGKIIAAVIIVILAHEAGLEVTAYFKLAEGMAGYALAYTLTFSIVSTGLDAIQQRVLEGKWPALAELAVSFVSNMLITRLFMGLGGLIKGFPGWARTSIMGLSFLGLSAAQWAAEHGGKLPEGDDLVKWWFENAGTFALLEASGRLMRPFDQSIQLWGRKRAMAAKPELQNELNDFYGENMKFQDEIADLMQTPQRLNELAKVKRDKLVNDLLPRQRSLAEKLANTVGPHDPETKLIADQKQKELAAIDEALAVLEQVDFQTKYRIAPLGESREAFEYEPGSDLADLEAALRKIHGNSIKFERTKDGNIRVEIPGAARPLLFYPRAPAAAAPAAPAPAPAGAKPNINDIGWKDIAGRVKGIADGKAKAIIDVRDTKFAGEFPTIDDVKGGGTGIGDELFARLAPLFDCKPPRAVQDLGQVELRRANDVVGRADRIGLKNRAIEAIRGTLDVSSKNKISETRALVDQAEKILTDAEKAAAEAGKQARARFGERKGMPGDWDKQAKSLLPDATDEEINAALAEIPSGGTGKVKRVLGLQPRHVRALVLLRRSGVSIRAFFEAARSVSLAQRDRALDLFVDAAGHRIEGLGKAMKEMASQGTKFIGTLWQLEVAAHFGWSNVEALEVKLLEGGLESVADIIFSKGSEGATFWLECKDWGPKGWENGKDKMAWQVVKRLIQNDWKPDALKTHRIVFRDPPPVVIEGPGGIREFIHDQVQDALKGAQHTDGSFLDFAEKQKILDAINSEKDLVTSSKLREDPGPLAVAGTDLDPTRPMPVPQQDKDKDKDKPVPPPP